MDECFAQKKNKDAEDISQQFSKDIVALSKRIISAYGDSRIPDFIDTPILSYIPKETVIEKNEKYFAKRNCGVRRNP